MLLSDTLLAMGISLGVLAASLHAWSNLRHSQQTVQALEHMLAQQREVQRLLERISLSAGATRVTTTSTGAVQWVSKGAPVSGTEGARDDTLTWTVPREMGPRDCQGNQASNLDLIGHQFKLSTKQELSCKDPLRFGTLFQALAQRVEDVQALYAEASDGADAHPAQAPLQWKTADQVLDWQHVRAVSVCLRWASPNKVAQASPSLKGCQGETVAADGRLRRLQRITLHLASQGDG
ncbi:MAG: hypothetical protein RJA69_588 [Pseudomonadota bacterium]|jgi:hypothetical protein